MQRERLIGSKAPSRDPVRPGAAVRRSDAGPVLMRLAQRGPAGKLISFYRYFQFDLPRVTTGSGLALLAGLGAAHLYLFVADQALAPGVNSPGYLRWYFLASSVVAVLSALCLLVRPTTGWRLGSLTCLAALGIYVASRLWSLPGLAVLVGYWSYPLGTAFSAASAAFVLLHLTVVTGMNVSYPNRQPWRDPAD